MQRQLAALVFQMLLQYSWAMRMVGLRHQLMAIKVGSAPGSQQMRQPQRADGQAGCRMQCRHNCLQRCPLTSQETPWDACSIVARMLQALLTLSDLSKVLRDARKVSSACSSCFVLRVEVRSLCSRQQNRELAAFLGQAATLWLCLALTDLHLASAVISAGHASCWAVSSSVSTG